MRLEGLGQLIQTIHLIGPGTSQVTEQESKISSKCDLVLIWSCLRGTVCQISIEVTCLYVFLLNLKGDAVFRRS
jgi:hypothetical protein